MSCQSVAIYLFRFQLKKLLCTLWLMRTSSRDEPKLFCSGVYYSYIAGIFSLETGYVGSLIKNNLWVYTWLKVHTWLKVNSASTLFSPYAELYIRGWRYASTVFRKKDCVLFGLWISYLGGLVELLAGIDITQMHISYTIPVVFSILFASLIHVICCRYYILLQCA